jgi:Tfp pilus assembly protein PilN
MIKINLLPPEIYAAKAQQQIKVLGLAIGVVVAVLLLGYYATQFKRSRDLDMDLAAAKSELQKYEALDAEVKSFQQQESQLNSRLSVIRQLLKGTLTYPKFFEDFIALLPADIWIGSLATTTDPSYGLAVTINAQSLTSFAIADWLTNLQQSPMCSNVKMGTITVAEQGDGRSPLYSFTMNFTFHRTDG